MKIILFYFALFCTLSGFTQKDGKLSTVDFVEILNNNTSEAEFYYENNWKKLRETAIKKAYIHSYEIIETEATEEAPFHLILITTYLNKEQYDQRENRFQELIAAAGELKLMNDKTPTEFRKNIFHKEMARHWKK